MRLQSGDRIEMIHQPDEIDPIDPGTTGTVTSVRHVYEQIHQVDVDWDNGRTLMVLIPGDQIRRVAS